MNLRETLKTLTPDGFKEALLSRVVTPEIEAYMARMPKPVGSFGYDPWGYNESQAKVGLGLAKLLYDHYFRVTSTGLENIPPRGRVLLIANHSGQLPMDGMMISVAVATNDHGPRVPRSMIERFFPTVPYIGNLFSSWGSVIGDPLNATKMLDAEELLIVFPEGVRGSGKPYAKRYELQRFGHGFMHMALTQKVPIIPVGVVGCEETMPSLLNLWPVAKLLGIPYFPLGPLLPLPARVYLNFGAPMLFEGCVTREEEVQKRVDQVKDAIRGLVAAGLAQRSRIF
jgi:1-acyl-sn-glycerol-3-phosphate acyltransferase